MSTPKASPKSLQKKVAVKKAAVKKPITKEVAVKKVAVKKAAVKKPITKEVAVKKVAVKKAAVKKPITKEVAVKKVAVKKAAVKKSSLENSIENHKDRFKIIFNISAVSPTEEDYSGTTITEWFDTGRAVDRYACPDDYKFSPKAKSYKVKWAEVINENLSKEYITEVIDQINYWASVFDAKIETGSKISYIDSKGKEFRIYSFDINEWIEA